MGNMCIVTVCKPGFDVINFEINLIFLNKLFCCMVKKSRQIFLYVENEKTFKDETKSMFHPFKGLSLKQLKISFKVRLSTNRQLIFICE